MSDVLLAVNGEASPARGNPACCRAGFRTLSPEVDGTGFVPRSGASCGTATCAPIRKRVIDAWFLRASLTQAVMPHGIDGPVTLSRPYLSGRFTVLANDANPASDEPWSIRPWEPSPWKTQDVGFSASRTSAQVPKADVTLANTYGTVCTKYWGFVPTGDGGLRCRVIRFTPAVNGGILSLFKDRASDRHRRGAGAAGTTHHPARGRRRRDADHLRRSLETHEPVGKTDGDRYGSDSLSIISSSLISSSIVSLSIISSAIVSFIPSSSVISASSITGSPSLV